MNRSFDCLLFVLLMLLVLRLQLQTTHSNCWFQCCAYFVCCMNFRCCAYGHFVDCHCHCFCCFRYFCYDCWQPAVLRNAEGNRVDGLLNRRAMERSI